MVVHQYWPSAMLCTILGYKLCVCVCVCAILVDDSVSLESWKRDGRRGVWLSIPLMQAELISVAAEVSCWNLLHRIIMMFV